jgi:hypothetical protein
MPPDHPKPAPGEIKIRRPEPAKADARNRPKLTPGTGQS